MRKPVFSYICKINGADQLPGNFTADPGLYFHYSIYLDNYTFPLLPKSEV